jgi:aldehyde:ferredoxin oxidoreductase
MPPPVAELIAAVTGWDFGWAEGLKAARRILTLRQAFNVREGVTPDKIDLPTRIKEEPLTTGPGANQKIDFQSLRKGYYTVMGWDPDTGKPSKETLSSLGLAGLTKDLR